jgi:glycosyltransferase involved in cell wall biosynthesis
MSTRLLYLVPDLLGPPGGIARYCRLVSQALVESGVEVRVVALMDRPGDAAPGADASWLLSGVSYTPCAGSRATFIRQAARQALQTRPGLVLAGHVNFAPLGWTLARLARARQVTFVYGIDAWTPLSRLRRSALQRCDRILAISHFTAAQAVQANALVPARVRVLHNCLDPQLEIASPGTRRAGPPSLLTVARMSLAEQYKGHDVVIRAMPELLHRFPDLRYDIVGDGDARPGLETLAQQMGVAEAVRFHGLVSEAALRERYSQASLFIMPSRAEGFGFVFLEAMAHGLPAIGGSIDATPEVIVDGETGLLVDPTSVDAVVAAVGRLLQDDDLRLRMGEAAQRHVASRFSYQSFRRQLIEELAQVAPAILPERG